MVERGELTVKEAGRIGGRKVKDRRGSEHYRRIGKIGGENLKKRVQEEDPDHFKKAGQRSHTPKAAAVENEPLSVKEAGSRGGKMVKELYGDEFFKLIGGKGGKAVAQKPGFHQEIGIKGGEALRDKHADDPDFFSNLGKKGGGRVKEKYGSEYYRRIGKIGGAAPRGSRRFPTT